jgi:enoyl-CoA hydratase/carnithine racemase
MTDTYVTLTKESPLGLITLDRPPANSYDLKFMQDLEAAIGGAGADEAIKVVLVVSASEKFFSGGADIKAFLANSPEANMDMVNLAHQALAKIARLPQIFIALINGHAMGGGLEIALACDMRFAGDGNFRMGLPESTLGLLPGNGGTQRLPRLIGAGRALEMMLNGTTVSPQQALELGLVNQVYPSVTALDEARAYALKLANGPSLALAHIKRCVHQGMDTTLAEGLSLERALVAELFASQDAREGLTAFVEKRRADFRGN